MGWIKIDKSKIADFNKKSFYELMKEINSKGGIKDGKLKNVKTRKKTKFVDILEEDYDIDSYPFFSRNARTGEIESEKVASFGTQIYGFYPAEDDFYYCRVLDDLNVAALTKIKENRKGEQEEVEILPAYTINYSTLHERCEYEEVVDSDPVFKEKENPWVREKKKKG